MERDHMRRLGKHKVPRQPVTASSTDLLEGRVAAPIRDADPHEGRVSSDDRVTLLPSRDCEVSINQSQVDSGAQPKRKSISASAFVCQFLVKLLVERHRRKLMVPEIVADEINAIPLSKLDVEVVRTLKSQRI